MKYFWEVLKKKKFEFFCDILKHYAPGWVDGQVGEWKQKLFEETADCSLKSIFDRMMQYTEPTSRTRIQQHSPDT